MEWIVNNLGLICSILASILSIVGAVLSIKSKNGKASKIVNGVSKVIKAFPGIIATSEKVGNTGEERKAYAMEQASLLCQALGFEPSEEQVHEFSEIIDTLVALTKEINVTSKTTTELKPLQRLGGDINVN